MAEISPQRNASQVKSAAAESVDSACASSTSSSTPNGNVTETYTVPEIYQDLPLSEKLVFWYAVWSHRAGRLQALVSPIGVAFPVSILVTFLCGIAGGVFGFPHALSYMLSTISMSVPVYYSGPVSTAVCYSAAFIPTVHHWLRAKWRASGKAIGNVRSEHKDSIFIVRWFWLAVHFCKEFLVEIAFTFTVLVAMWWVLWALFEKARKKIDNQAHYSNPPLVELVTRVFTALAGIAWLVVLVASTWSDASTVLSNMIGLINITGKHLSKAASVDEDDCKDVKPQAQPFVKGGSLQGHSGLGSSGALARPEPTCTFAMCANCTTSPKFKAHWVVDGVTAFDAADLIVFHEDYQCRHCGWAATGSIDTVEMSDARYGEYIRHLLVCRERREKTTVMPRLPLGTCIHCWTGNNFAAAKRLIEEWREYNGCKDQKQPISDDPDVQVQQMMAAAEKAKPPTYYDKIKAIWEKRGKVLIITCAVVVVLMFISYGLYLFVCWAYWRWGTIRPTRIIEYIRSPSTAPASGPLSALPTPLQYVCEEKSGTVPIVVAGQAPVPAPLVENPPVKKEKKWKYKKHGNQLAIVVELEDGTEMVLRGKGVMSVQEPGEGLVVFSGDMKDDNYLYVVPPPGNTPYLGEPQLPNINAVVADSKPYTRAKEVAAAIDADNGNTKVMDAVVEEENYDKKKALYVEPDESSSDQTKKGKNRKSKRANLGNGTPPGSAKTAHRSVEVRDDRSDDDDPFYYGDDSKFGKLIDDQSAKIEALQKCINLQFEKERNSYLSALKEAVGEINQSLQKQISQVEARQTAVARQSVSLEAPPSVPFPPTVGHQATMTVKKHDEKEVCPFLLKNEVCPLKPKKSQKAKTHRQQFAHPAKGEVEKAKDQGASEWSAYDAALVQQLGNQSTIGGSLPIEAVQAKLAFFVRRTETVDTIIGTAFRVASMGFSAGHLISGGPTHLAWFGATQPSWKGAKDVTTFKTEPLCTVPMNKLKFFKYSEADTDDKLVFAWPEELNTVEAYKFGEVAVGEMCYVWGYHSEPGKVRVAQGLVRYVGGGLAIATASTDWGTSGGPWFNRLGQVIGVHKGVVKLNEENKCCLFTSNEKLVAHKPTAVLGDKWTKKAMAPVERRWFNSIDPVDLNGLAPSSNSPGGSLE